MSWNKQFIAVGIFLLIFSPSFSNATTFGEGRDRLTEATSQAGFAYAEPTSVLERIIDYLLAFVGALATLAIVVAGVRLIAGMGNEQQAETAKSILKWAIIGLMIVIFSWVILRIVLGDLLGVKL